MIDKKDLVAVREGRESDRNFILATLLRGLYYGDSWYSLVPKSTFMEHYHPIATWLISLPSTKIRVACLKDDPEVILGYAVMSQDETRLDWVFCKSAWRAIGIAKSLVPDTIKQVTHLTKVGLSILKSKPGVEFNPFLIK